MKISLQDAGKRFNRDWIFRHFNFNFEPGGTYAITGINGSGKSTLLQVIVGAILHSEGKIIYTENEKSVEYPYKSIAITTPYLELIEEMTAVEMLNFHKKFKQLTDTNKAILDTVSLKNSADKQIRYFSSGMKQRLKLALAFFSDASVLLLDEPVTNLDQQGIDLYHELVRTETNGKTVIVSSNDPQEYGFCKETIKMEDYKIIGN